MGAKEQDIVGIITVRHQKVIAGGYIFLDHDHNQQGITPLVPLVSPDAD